MQDKTPETCSLVVKREADALKVYLLHLMTKCDRMRSDEEEEEKSYLTVSMNQWHFQSCLVTIFKAWKSADPV